VGRFYDNKHLLRSQVPRVCNLVHDYSYNVKIHTSDIIQRTPGYSYGSIHESPSRVSNRDRGASNIFINVTCRKNSCQSEIKTQQVMEQNEIHQKEEANDNVRKLTKSSRFIGLVSIRCRVSIR